MDIKAYLVAEGISQEQFAKRVGVSQGLVWQWINGKTNVTPRRAKDIERETGGKVSREEACPELVDERKRRAGDRRAAGI